MNSIRYPTWTPEHATAISAKNRRTRSEEQRHASIEADLGKSIAAAAAKIQADAASTKTNAPMVGFPGGCSSGAQLAAAGQPVVAQSRDGWPVFEAMLRSNHLPLPIYEYRFDPVRKWRFDMAWPEQKIALEVDGGIWARGNSGHSSGTGIMRDMSKGNAAQVLGWRYLRYTPDNLATAVDDLNMLIRG